VCKNAKKSLFFKFREGANAPYCGTAPHCPPPNDVPAIQACGLKLYLFIGLHSLLLLLLITTCIPPYKNVFLYFKSPVADIGYHRE